MQHVAIIGSAGSWWCSARAWEVVGGGGGGGGGGEGIRPVARLSEGGHLAREAACCELHRLVHCSATVLNHGLCRKIPLLSLGGGGGGGGGGGCRQM